MNDGSISRRQRYVVTAGVAAFLAVDGLFIFFSFRAPDQVSEFQPPPPNPVVVASAHGTFADQVSELKAEDFPKSLENLPQFAMFMWPGIYRADALTGGFPPLNPLLERQCLDRILSNRRFLKIYRESYEEPEGRVEQVRRVAEAEFVAYRSSYENLLASLRKAVEEQPGMLNRSQGFGMSYTDVPGEPRSPNAYKLELMALVLILAQHEDKAAGKFVTEVARYAREQYRELTGNEQWPSHIRMGICSHCSLYEPCILTSALIGTGPPNLGNEMGLGDAERWKKVRIPTFDSPFSTFELQGGQDLGYSESFSESVPMRLRETVSDEQLSQVLDRALQSVAR